MTQRRVDIPPFSFMESRTGRGTPVILIHGLSGSHRWWRRNVDELARDHLVVTIDLIGFGSSRKLAGLSSTPLQFDDISAVLARWISSSFEERVHLVGHSMGGQIAIHLAARYPDLVRSLVLVGSTGVPFALHPMPHIAAAARPPRGTISFLRVLAADFVRAGPMNVGLAAARLLSNDAREAMRHVAVPTLLVWGARDPLVPSRYAEAMASEIEGASLALLPDAGHIPMWDSASAFNEQVTRFLAEADESFAAETRERIFSWPIVGVAGGLAYRSSGEEPAIVLVHGLGIPSLYFRSLARSLWTRGWNCIAPDLPGFGFSRERRVEPQDDAAALIAWADALNLRNVVWIGHSTGAQAVERVFRERPDLVRRAVFASPIWSPRPYLLARILTRMPADALMESPGLDLLAIEAYWEAGLGRLFRLARFYVSDAQELRRLPARSIIVAGAFDPFAEWEYWATLETDAIVKVPGAHGMHFNHPEETASALEAHLDLDRRRANGNADE